MSSLPEKLRDLLVMVQERRLPYRVEKKLNDWLYKRNTDVAIQQVLGTEPIQLDTTSSAEIRMLINKRDLCMCILALKSLLRFCPKFKVYVHGDGSLTEHEADILREHIVGAEVVTMGEADAVFCDYPEINTRRQQCFNLIQWMPISTHKLFDLHHLSTSDFLIIMDSDILFLKEPATVLHWLENGPDYSLYPRPYLRNLAIPEEVLKERLGEHKFIEHFNSGFLCINKKHICMDRIIEVCDALKDEEGILIKSDECIWRLILSMHPAYELPFDDYPLFTSVKVFRRYLKRNNSPLYVHFLLKHHGGFYRDMANQVVAELAAR